MLEKKEKSRPEQRGPQDPLTKRVSLPAHGELLEEWWLSYGWEERSKGSTVKYLSYSGRLMEKEKIKYKDGRRADDEYWRSAGC